MPETTSAIQDNLRIREMTIDDFPAVFHIGEQVFTAESFQSLYRTWDEYEVLGFALGTTVTKHNSPWKYGYLVWLGVRTDIQQGGVGSGLFKEIKHRMKEQGVRMMIIDTSADNRPAIRFFEKQGFGDVQEHVYMSLNLTRKSRKKPVKKP